MAAKTKTPWLVTVISGGMGQCLLSPGSWKLAGGGSHRFRIGIGASPGRHARQVKGCRNLGGTGVSPVGFGVSPKRTFFTGGMALFDKSRFHEVRAGETPAPTGGTPVLPGRTPGSASLNLTRMPGRGGETTTSTFYFMAASSTARPCRGEYGFFSHRWLTLPANFN